MPFPWIGKTTQKGCECSQECDKSYLHLQEFQPTPRFYRFPQTSMSTQPTSKHSLFGIRSKSELSSTSPPAQPPCARGRTEVPFPRQLVVRIVPTPDTKAKEFAGSALDLLALGFQRALQQLVAVLQVPVIPPVLVDAPNGQEVVAR